MDKTEIIIDGKPYIKVIQPFIEDCEGGPVSDQRFSHCFVSKDEIYPLAPKNENFAENLLKHMYKKPFTKGNLDENNNSK